MKHHARARAALARALLVAGVALHPAACSQSHPFTDAARVDTGSDVPATPTSTPCDTDPTGEATGGCSAGQFCLSVREGFPGGYCAPDCLRRACPEGTECYPVNGARRYCVRRCSSDADCRTAEGYVCRLPALGAAPACLPNDAPVGHRAGGGACYTAGDGADGGAGPFLAPLPRAAFTAPAASISRGMVGTRAEVEPVIALAPDATRGAVTAWVGFDDRGNWRGGAVRLGADGQVTGVTTLHDLGYPDLHQPSVAFDRTGRLHGAYIANDLDRPGNPVRYVASDDGGLTFAAPRNVFDDSVCNGGCPTAVLAVGPAVKPAADVVYAAALALSNGAASLMLARANAADGTFSPAVMLAQSENAIDARRAPASVAIAAGPEPGAVTVAWVAANTDNGLSGLGDPLNRVHVRLSRDGGQTFGPDVDVTRRGDAPVAQAPMVARGGGRVAVVYVTGGLSGAWDVVLATRSDEGAQWTHRVVNDDPDRCATHAFAALAVEPTSGDAHVLWLDNRYGPGLVAYARCPADATARCDRNEVVSDEPFPFTTSLDPTRWHGTHSSLARAPDGTLWASWSDTRTGGPGVYLAHGHP